MERKRPRSHLLPGSSLLMRRGHCAPTVMETLLRAGRGKNPGLVKLVAGLPGGVGDTGYECGGIMSSLVFFGLETGPDEIRDGLPLVLVRSQAHIRRFIKRHATPFCREIRGEKGKQRIWPCVKAILDSPGIYGYAAADAVPNPAPDAERDAHRLLVSGLKDRGFHCSQAVFDRLPEFASSYSELRRGLAAFVGGTACRGWTCGALTAGIMLVGRRTAEIENNVLRVMRMIILMKTGGDAFADRINAFNITMNLGNRMARWFTAEFGSTQCRAITGADFSTPAGVRRFLDARAAACEGIAGKVAAKVEAILRSTARDRAA